MARNPARRRKGPLCGDQDDGRRIRPPPSPLRNIALTAPCFSAGKIRDLSVAVEIMAESQLGAALKPEETAQLVAFLETLTGSLAEVTLPVLPAETATTPRPTTMIQ